MPLIHASLHVFVLVYLFTFVIDIQETKYSIQETVPINSCRTRNNFLLTAYQTNVFVACAIPAQIILLRTRYYIGRFIYTQQNLP